MCQELTGAYVQFVFEQGGTATIDLFTSAGTPPVGSVVRAGYQGTWRVTHVLRAGDAGVGAQVKATRLDADG